MKYTVRRIDLGSALRVGLALGWLVALFPSLALAWVGLLALRRLNDALGQIAPFDLSVLGQTIARIDLLQLLGLANLVGSVARLSGNGLLTFATIAAVLTIAGAAMIAITLLAFCLCYNGLARLAGGVTLELEAS